MKILFVCHGNICRSPMAEFVLKNMINETPGLNPGDFVVESVATSREEIGNDIYPPAKNCMLMHGIPFESRHARQMTQADYDAYDYIIVMDERNIGNIKRIIGEDSKHKITKLLDWAGISRDVADPWYTGDFEATYKDVKAGCQALLDSLINVEPGRYRHYKGNEYEVLDMAKHTETLEPLVIYRALYGEGKVWARSAIMWKEKVVVDGEEVPRFKRI